MKTSDAERKQNSGYSRIGIHAMRLAITAVAMLAMSPSLADAAANSPAKDCPSGKLQRLRVSEIVPGGSLAGFKAAFADHARWYASHGYAADRLSISPVVGEYGKSRARHGAMRVVTIHSGVSNVPREKQDEAWRAFAQKYRANSRIVSTTLTCTV
ncbi:MAG: hypothetical protein ACKOPO_12985 [Novosphingobium sp.]